VRLDAACVEARVELVMLLSHVGLFASASTAGEALAGVAGPTVAWALAGGYAVAPAAHAGCVETPSLVCLSPQPGGTGAERRARSHEERRFPKRTWLIRYRPGLITLLQLRGLPASAWPKADSPKGWQWRRTARASGRALLISTRRCCPRSPITATRTYAPASVCRWVVVDRQPARVKTAISGPGADEPNSQNVNNLDVVRA
jgi:hypothetical protein